MGHSSIRRRPRHTSLTFQATVSADSTCEYDWVEASTAEVKSIPVEHFDGTTVRPQNQCMFIHGFKIALGQGLWASFFKVVEISEIEGGPRDRKSGIANFPFSSLNYWYPR